MPRSHDPLSDLLPGPPSPALAVVFMLGLLAGALLGPQDDRPARCRRAPAFQSLQPASPSADMARGSHPSEVLRVLDGDTFEARVHIWPGIDITTKVRLRGIDAPELRAHCADERSKAEAAREALRAILAEGDVAVAHVGVDKYGGRVLADATTRMTADVGATMLAKGHARPYAGGRRQSWCDGSQGGSAK